MSFLFAVSGLLVVGSLDVFRGDAAVFSQICQLVFERPDKDPSEVQSIIKL